MRRVDVRIVVEVPHATVEERGLDGLVGEEFCEGEVCCVADEGFAVGRGDGADIARVRGVEVPWAKARESQTAAATAAIL